MTSPFAIFAIILLNKMGLQTPNAFDESRNNAIFGCFFGHFTNRKNTEANAVAHDRSLRNAFWESRYNLLLSKINRFKF